jgi:3-methyladenine DNA glycosylase Tag
MRPFADIVDMAQQFHTAEEIADGLRGLRPKPPSEIAATSDDRILALMAQRIFSAGFSRKVIEAKWPAFEEAFWRFSVRRCAALYEPDLDELMANKAIVRNGPKILAIHDNAHFLLALANEHGSAAQAFAQWPDDRYFELVDLIRRKGSRLGGDTSMRFLRDLGKPALILTKDVTAALIREGVITSPATSRKALDAVQTAANRWAADSGYNLTEISRYLAWSVGLSEKIAEHV